MPHISIKKQNYEKNQFILFLVIVFSRCSNEFEKRSVKDDLVLKKYTTPHL